MANNKLVLYGTDLSQPCRTVSWLLRLHNVPFEYEQIMPGSKKGTRDPEFIKTKNPNATVPVLEHNGVILHESAAIIVYLAEALKWDDVYPSGPQNVAKRAAINTWLHWSHRNSREFTIGLFAPLLRKDLKFTPEKIKELTMICTKSAKVMEDQLTRSKFLAGDSPTLADFAVYADAGQCSKAMLDLFDFTPFPNVSSWLKRMESLPHWTETHESIEGLKGMIEDAKAAAKAKAKL